MGGGSMGLYKSGQFDLSQRLRRTQHRGACCDTARTGVPPWLPHEHPQDFKLP